MVFDAKLDFLPEIGRLAGTLHVKSDTHVKLLADIGSLLNELNGCVALLLCGIELFCRDGGLHLGVRLLGLNRGSCLSNTLNAGHDRFSLVTNRREGLSPMLSSNRSAETYNRERIPIRRAATIARPAPRNLAVEKTDNRLLDLRHPANEVVFKLLKVAKVILEIVDPRFCFVLREQWFLGKHFQVLHILFGTPLDQKVIPCPRLGIAVNRRSWMAQPIVGRNQRFQICRFAIANVLAEAIPPVVVHLVGAAPTAVAGKIGRFKVDSQALAEPNGIVHVARLQSAVERDLVRRLVDDCGYQRQRLGIIEQGRDIFQATPIGTFTPQRLRTGEIVHDDPIRLKTVVANRIARGRPKLGSSMFDIGGFVIEDEHCQRRLRSMNFASSFLPESEKAFLKTFQQRATPLGVFVGRVVYDDVVLGFVQTKVGSHFGKQALAKLLFVERHHRLVIAGAFKHRLAVDGPHRTFVGFEQHAARRIFDDDLAREFLLVPVHVDEYMLKAVCTVELTKANQDG